MQHFDTLPEILLLVVQISAVAVIIMDNRHPVKALAWALVILFVPVLGLILYFLFGLNLHRKSLISRSEHEELMDLKDKGNAQFVINSPPEDYERLIHLMRETAGADLLDGNAVEVYTGCPEMYSALYETIESAEHHVHIQFFKFLDDAAGYKLGELLMRKAEEGVEVRLLYDDAANLPVKQRFYRKLRKSGVQVQAFMRLWLPFLSRRSNYRNHRKIVVVDGRVGFIGGMNIAKRYYTGVHGGIWRDTHLKVKGPAVNDLQASFIADWRYAADEWLADPAYFPDVEPAGNIMMQIVSAGPTDSRDVLMYTFVEIISRSRKYVYIQSPYFLPTAPVMAALTNAALSGVDVRIMLPVRGDQGNFTHKASCSYIKEALDAGIRICFYDNGYLHSKTIVCDDTFVTIGSTNMDFRSFEHDFEANAFIYDERMACDARETFIADERYCTYMDSSSWAARPLFSKIYESVARLFSPLL